MKNSLILCRHNFFPISRVLRSFFFFSIFRFSFFIGCSTVRFVYVLLTDVRTYTSSESMFTLAIIWCQFCVSFDVFFRSFSLPLSLAERGIDSQSIHCLCVREELKAVCHGTVARQSSSDEIEVSNIGRRNQPSANIKQTNFRRNRNSHFRSEWRSRVRVWQ